MLGAWKSPFGEAVRSMQGLPLTYTCERAKSLQPSELSHHWSIRMLMSGNG